MDTMNTTASDRSDLELIEVNRRFYDPLWTDARLVKPERFNTWPLVCSLVSPLQNRLEIAPGLRPRLPIEGTHFVDISAPAIAKLQAHGANAIQGLVSALPFQDGAFDLVCAFDIVEHVADDDAALSELSRVAAPGATFLISVPLHPSRWTPFDDFVGHCRRYEPEHLLAMLAEYGFEVKQSAVYGMQPKSSYLLDIGMWFLTHRRARALWWYNNIFMPLGVRFQKKLDPVPGMIAAENVDEILLVCQKSDALKH
jgi:SAM-dependent methyltransferase